MNRETGNTEATNFTILNTFLVVLGPMKEDSLVKVLIASQVSTRAATNAEQVFTCAHPQVAGSTFAFAIRYGLAWLLYDGNRR